jgi:succinyl-CoA synthetase beta subunit
MNFDDNALFRHKDVADMRDLTQEDPREVEAAKYDLNYIGLDGNIACLGPYFLLLKSSSILLGLYIFIRQ